MGGDKKYSSNNKSEKDKNSLVTVLSVGQTPTDRGKTSQEAFPIGLFLLPVIFFNSSID